VEVNAYSTGQGNSCLYRMGKNDKKFPDHSEFFFVADYFSLEIKVTTKSFSSSMKGFFCVLVLGEILVR
jgi:hypothetical protein